MYFIPDLTLPSDRRSKVGMNRQTFRTYRAGSSAGLAGSQEDGCDHKTGAGDAGGTPVVWKKAGKVAIPLWFVSIWQGEPRIGIQAGTHAPPAWCQTTLVGYMHLWTSYFIGIRRGGVGGVKGCNLNTDENTVTGLV